MSQKRIAKVGLIPRLEATSLTEGQEYAELQKNPLDGIKIMLPNEADMHQWQIAIEGPKGSPYEVSSLGDLILAITCSVDSQLLGRRIRSVAHSTEGIPFQTSDALFQDQDIPSQRDKR